MNSVSLDVSGSQWIDFSVWLQNSGEDNSEQLQRLRQKLPQAMARELTPRQREVLTLHYVHQLSSAQIARALGVNRSTVCRTLHRAENRLRHCLEYTL